MTKVAISLPDPLAEWAEKEAESNGFDSVGDYIEIVLRQEQERHQALAELDRLIQECEDSGISDRTMDEIFIDARQQAQNRLKAKTV